MGLKEKEAPNDKYNESERSYMRTVELEQEEDGRWIAEATWLPGAMTYGKTLEDAFRRLSAYLDELKAQEGTTAVNGSSDIGWSPQFGHKIKGLQGS
jgi:predicted RNase H-like HicB family nuclease